MRYWIAKSTSICELDILGTKVLNNLGYQEGRLKYHAFGNSGAASYQAVAVQLTHFCSATCTLSYL